jgi:hypothetical protein
VELAGAFVAIDQDALAALAVADGDQHPVRVPAKAGARRETLKVADAITAAGNGGPAPAALSADEPQLGQPARGDLALDPARDHLREPTDDAAGVLAAGAQPALAHGLEVEFHLHADIVAADERTRTRRPGGG